MNEKNNDNILIFIENEELYLDLSYNNENTDDPIALHSIDFE